MGPSQLRCSGLRLRRSLQLSTTLPRISIRTVNKQEMLIIKADRKNVDLC